MDGRRQFGVHLPWRAVARRGMARPALIALALAVGLAACRSTRRPRSEDPWYRAESAAESGDWSAAADRWYTIFEREGVTDVRPCVETARALLELGDANGASAFAELGLRYFPDDPDLLELQADALVAQGFRRAAEGWYERVLSIDPDRATSLMALAEQRIALGMENSAVQPLEQLVRIGAADERCWTLLARARQTTGRPLAAYDAWVEAFELGDGIVADRVRASTLCLDPQVGRTRADAQQRCVSWLERVIELDPQCTPAHFQLGVVLEHGGDAEGAARAYRRAAETDPACLMALTNLAILCAAQGDVAATHEMVDRALELEPDDSRRRALMRLLDNLEADEEATGDDSSDTPESKP